MKKVFLTSLFLIIIINLFAINVYADGWVDDGVNWHYVENGKYVRGDVRNIDGENYYFDTYGNWIPREENKLVKLKGSEKKSFVIEGKDDIERPYKVTYTYILPIVGGKNEEEINKFISDNIEETIKTFIEEKYKNALFLLENMGVYEMMEYYNEKDTIGFSYLGSPRYSININYNKKIMWVTQ